MFDSKIDEEKGTLHCAECGDIMGFLNFAFDRCSFRCIGCGPEEQDDE